MVSKPGPVVISKDFYLKLRQRCWQAGHKDDYDWSESIKPPATADDFFCEYLFVVCNSGMSHKAGRVIYEKIRDTLPERPHTVFGHKQKCDSIWHTFRKRHTLFKTWGYLITAEQKLDFLQRLRHIGPVTKWHLAKNFGVDCAKPDRHLVRIAGSHQAAHDLCARLSMETGDRIATVDVTLWRCCANGWL